MRVRAYGEKEWESMPPMITGDTTPLSGATKAMFQNRSMPQPPKKGWLASRSMALILPSISRVDSPTR